MSASNKNEEPEWWTAIKGYLTEKQQSNFIKCYHALFAGKQHPSILWALVNSLGLLSVILNDIVKELFRNAQTLERTNLKLEQLRTQVDELTRHVDASVSALHVAALSAHEAANELRNSQMPWVKILTIIGISSAASAFVSLSAVAIYFLFARG